jgi:hypothetical protein
MRVRHANAFQVGEEESRSPRCPAGAYPTAMPTEPGSHKTLRWSKADSNSGSHPRATPPAATRFVADSALEQARFEPSVPVPTAVACPPISLDSSSTKTTSWCSSFASALRTARRSEDCAQVPVGSAEFPATLGFEKPSNFRIKLTFSIFYVFGLLLLAAFVLVRVDFPPTQPSL